MNRLFSPLFDGSKSGLIFFKWLSEYCTLSLFTVGKTYNVAKVARVAKRSSGGGMGFSPSGKRLLRRYIHNFCLSAMNGAFPTG